MANDSGNTVIALGGLAILGFLGFMLYQQKKGEDLVDETLDPIKNIIKTVIDPFIPDDDGPGYTLDAHGCRSDIQHWCSVDGFCKDIAQACSLPPEPPVTCWDGSTAKYGYLCPVHIEIEPEPEPKPTVRIGDICYKNGYPLNVPQGTSCDDAFQVMCQRFGPGSKYC